MSEENITTAKLLALLNVSAARPGKRKRDADTETKTVKLNRRSTKIIVEDDGKENMEIETSVEVLEEEITDTGGPTSTLPTEIDALELHFSNKTQLLAPRTIEALSPPGEHARVRWSISRKQLGPGLSAVTSILEDRNGVIDSAKIAAVGNPSGQVLNHFWRPFFERSKKLDENLRKMQEELLPELLSYRDVHHSHISASSPHEQSAMRDATSLHLVNHVWKNRQKVVQNNTVASQEDSSVDPESLQDQGFVRPSILILSPFRNSALRWVKSLLDQFPSTSNKIAIAEHERFFAEFSLPEGTVDKLAEAEDLGIYPEDHVQTFKGNIDDNFRAGIKVVNKGLKLFETFYGSDILLASPLALRLAIEREGNDDFLSSIEVVLVDQVDVMTMQNWTHLQFVFSHLNNLPKDSHDTDFSRVKSWYLDGNAKYLRQNVLISSYETPQMRAFFNGELRNVAGKIRFERRWAGVEIPQGVQQDFVKFECSTAREEVDKRFEFFTKEFFPTLKKSAVLSANTLIFIPSFFDFIRVRNWMRRDGASAAFISEESSVPEMDRARHQFDKGKKAFLAVTERFHFFRRYRLKGIINIVFYGPPDHAHFYPELLSFPFFRKDVDATDVTVKLIYSKYDAMALERLVGTKEAAALIK